MKPDLFRNAVCAAAIAAAGALAVAKPALAAENDPSIEYAVKAAYLYKFAPFVQWPETQASKAFTICIMGADPFGSILDKSVVNQRINERAIAVRRLTDAAATQECNVAYITRPARQALTALRGQPVLTITDDAESPEERGVIHFVIRDNRVRFEINEAAAAQQGLEISSKLLKLAVPATSPEAGPP